MPDSNWKDFIKNRKKTPPTPKLVRKPDAPEEAVKTIKEAPKQDKPKPVRTTPPAIGYEKILVKCGHEVAFELYEDKKDKYREQRRAKALSLDCKACRLKKQIDMQETALKRKKEKRVKVDKALFGWYQPKKVPRLPHGSRIVFDPYDAEKKKWHGSLFVLIGVEDKQFGPFADSSLFKLQHRLYMEYLKATNQEVILDPEGESKEEIKEASDIKIAEVEPILAEEVPKGKYQHFKGGLYEVIGVALHSETQEELVTYRSLSEDNKLWVRPKSMFLTIFNANGTPTPRFKYLGPVLKITKEETSNV